MRKIDLLRKQREENSMSIKTLQTQNMELTQQIYEIRASKLRGDVIIHKGQEWRIEQFLSAFEVFANNITTGITKRINLLEKQPTDQERLKEIENNFKFATYNKVTERKLKNYLNNGKKI